MHNYYLYLEGVHSAGFLVSCVFVGRLLQSGPLGVFLGRIMSALLVFCKVWSVGRIFVSVI